MKEITANGYTRIDKREAFKLYKSGQTIYLATSNITPSYGNMIKITPLHEFNNDNSIKDYFDDAINSTKARYCNKENGKDIYYYKLSPSETKYKLSADFGNKVRLINIMTGGTVDVEKEKVIERMETRQIEVLGYSVSPDRKNIIAYR